MIDFEDLENQAYIFENSAIALSDRNDSWGIGRILAMGLALIAKILVAGFSALIEHEND